MNLGFRVLHIDEMSLEQLKVYYKAEQHYIDGDKPDLEIFTELVKAKIVVAR